MKKEPIVFLLPDSLKDREFAVCFEKYIKDVSKMFVIDMEEIKLKPQTGVEARLMGIGGLRMETKLIKEYNPLCNGKY